ncbi:hypothetical protein [Nocardioides jejuensis]|uniref:Mce-associated membrane protein n=1 Tax=Nocardioides jejuensis TaxID=2502782 RepID=A0A4R1CK19_9ACTN|nr:hypothetical protein [Nocardioides jejuensis]TCJ30348.1 hypothetical protein EPD65_03860 [Nocardioides jejuensis]
MTLEHGAAARPGRRILFVALCLALAAALAVLVVRSLNARDTEQAAGGGHGSATERAAVLAVADEFAKEIDTYGASDLDAKGAMPDYRKRISAILTTKFRTAFDQEVELAEKAVAQTRIEVASRLDASGVVSIDGDRATVLAAWERTASYPKTTPGAPVLKRASITLVKVEGHWLVDDFTTVTGEGQ